MYKHYNVIYIYIYILYIYIILLYTIIILYSHICICMYTVWGSTISGMTASLGGGTESTIYCERQDGRGYVAILIPPKFGDPASALVLPILCGIFDLKSSVVVCLVTHPPLPFQAECT